MGPYTVQQGDTLMTIAQKFWGDSKRYYKIAEANPGIDVNNLYVGQVIQIPTAGAVTPVLLAIAGAAVILLFMGRKKA